MRTRAAAPSFSGDALPAVTVPVGSKVRLRATLNGVELTQGGASGTIGLTFEVEGQQKPACVAEAIYRYYF